MPTNLQILTMSRVCENIDCQNKGTLHCSACKLAFYCNSYCQRSDWKRHKLECVKIKKTNNEVRTSVCGNNHCHNEGYLKCSVCLLVSYCHKGCQKKDWKQHKLICTKKTTKNLPDFMPPKRVEQNKTYQDCIEMMGDMFSSRFDIHNKRPQYHLEYAQAYPNNKDIYQKISGFYYNNIMNLASIKKGNFGDQLLGFGSLIQILTKRWMYFGPPLIDFLNKRPQPGTICPIRPSGFQDREYGSIPGSTIKKFHMMRNTPVYMKVFEPGNHVSVGFVDLIQLLYADFSPEEGTVKWYSFEKNVLLFARAKLILTMLFNETIPDHVILQVWFSSLLSSEAANIVIKTCLDLSKSEEDEQIKSIYTYWSKSKLSCHMAATLWSAHIPYGDLGPLELLSAEKDRVFYARYLYRGELFIGSSVASCGNITMLCIPPEMQDYHTRGWDNLFYSFAAGLFYQTSLESSIESKLSSGIENLRKALIDKKLVVSLNLENICLTNTTALTLIRDLEPLTIDWTNVPEYIASDKFHSIIRFISSTETKHSAHFMNWTMAIFGTNPIDFLPTPITAHALDNLLSVNMPNIDQLGKKWMTEKKSFLKNGLSKLPFLHKDPDLHIFNFMDNAVEVLAHPYKDKYIDLYFHHSDDVTAQLIIQDQSMNRIDLFSINVLLQVSFQVVKISDSL